MATAYTRRELKEMVLALDYSKNYNHGTSGHNDYVIIAKLTRDMAEHSPLIGRMIYAFDHELFHKADDIVAMGIEFSPTELLPEVPRSK